MSSQSSNYHFNSPEAVMQIMTQLNEIIDTYESMACRRMLPRREIVLPVLIQFLDENKQPCTGTFEGISLDISFGGIGFMCHGACPNGEHALIQFTESLGQHVPIIVEIKNKEMVGSFCQIGGVFEVNWTDPEDEDLQG